MRTRITFECEVLAGKEAFIERLIRYNFSHVENIEIKELVDAESKFIPASKAATCTIANRRII